MKEFVSHSWINHNTIEKRDYQESIVKNALQKNTLCVIPTGLGKTSIAAIVVAERMKQDFETVNSGKKLGKNLFSFSGKNEYAKVLFLAPTKPLVNQHFNFFERVFKVGNELQAVTGEMDVSKRKEVYEKTDIVFATPQTIRNDLKNCILDLRLFCLLIVDEAHRSVGNYAYPYVAKKFIEQSRSPLILALTASPGSNRAKLKEICDTLFIENVEIRQREDSDVKDYIKKMNQEIIELELPPELVEIKLLLEECRLPRLKKLAAWHLNVTEKSSKRQLLYLQQELAKRKSGFSFAAMSTIAEVIKIDHASLLLGTQSMYSLINYLNKLPNDGTKAAERLMKDETFIKAAERSQELYLKKIENPKITKLQEIVQKEMKSDKRIIVFVQYRDTADIIHSSLKDIPNSRPVIFIGQAKRNVSARATSVGASSGRGMNQKEQVDTIRPFKSGEFNVLIATSIGEEGLDIEETDMVIFYEPVPSEIRSIQRAGRTARTRPGKVIMLIVKNTVDEIYYWSAHHKKKKMISMLDGMKNSLGKY